MKNISSAHCAKRFNYTNIFKYKIIFIFGFVYILLAISSLLLLYSAKNTNFLFALDIPFFSSPELITTPTAELKQEIECYENVKISISSINKCDGLISVTTVGTNNSNSTVSFSSDQFQMTSQNIATPYGQELLIPTNTWQYDFKTHSKYSFTQYFKLCDDKSAFTLTMYGSDNEKIAQFLLLSSDIA